MIPTHPLSPLPSAPPVDDFELLAQNFQSQAFLSTMSSALDHQSIYPDFSAPVPVQLDVRQFYTDSSKPYTYKTEHQAAIPSIDLNSMPIHLTTTPFNPHEISEDDRYMLPWINSVADIFIKSHQGTSVLETLKFAEEFVNRFIFQMIRHYGTSASISDQPLFPCLEIALRAQLFHKIIEKERAIISQTFREHNKFPNDLIEIEKRLFKLLTKDYFFICMEFSVFDSSFNYSPLFNGFVLADVVVPLKKSYLSKIASLPASAAIDSAEVDLTQILKDCNLPENSSTTLVVNFLLRREFGQALIEKQVYEFKQQFHKTGTVSQENFDITAGKINSFITAQGNCLIGYYVKGAILTQLFDLNMQSNNPSAFQALESQKNVQIAALPVPSRAAKFFSSLLPSSGISKQQLLQNQLGTLGWARSEWEALFNPPTIPESVAPPLEPLANGSVQEVADADLDGWAIVTPPSSSVLLANEPPAVIQQPALPSEQPAPIQEPPVKAFRPPMPLPIEPPLSEVSSAEVQKPEPARFTVNSLDIPLVSYINITCREAIKNAGDDVTFWNSLPPLIQRDALRHCYYLFDYRGKAEEVAVRIFKQSYVVKSEIDRLEACMPPLPQIRNLSHAFIEKGERLLALYYLNRDQFFKEFNSLPGEPLFYQYVYEMAKEAGVHIESWDREFGKYNWNKPTMMKLSVQALERCLHTNNP